MAVVTRVRVTWVVLAALLATMVGIVPASAADDVEVRLTVTASGAPLQGGTVSLSSAGSLAALAIETSPGLYVGSVPPGGYAVTVVPPDGSTFAATTVPLSVTAPGPVEASVALVPATPPGGGTPGPTTTVRGRVRGGIVGDGSLGRVGDRPEVRFTANGVVHTTIATTDGGYAIALPHGTYVVGVHSSQLTTSRDGWPDTYALTLPTPLEVGPADDGLTVDLDVPFQAQVLRTETTDGSPAPNVQVRAEGAGSAAGAPAGTPVVWSTRSTRRTGGDGAATVWVLPGDHRLTAFAGFDFVEDVVVPSVALPTSDAQVLTLEPRTVTEATGRVVDREGNGLGGGTARLRSASGQGPSVSVASDGTFLLQRPQFDGPYTLTISSPSLSGADARLDARPWSIRVDELQLDGPLDLGDIVVDGTRTEVCVVDTATGETVVPTRVTTSPVAVDLDVAGLPGELTYTSNVVRLSSACAETVLPPDATIDVVVAPGSAFDGYIPTRGSIVTGASTGQTARVELGIQSFASLSQDVAVDVTFGLANRAGTPLDDLVVDLLPDDDDLFRSTYIPQGGRAETRLVRERHVASGAPLDRDRPGVPRNGGFTIDLALDASDPTTRGVDLGVIEVPWIPVDVIARGAEGAPLSSAVVSAPQRQGCVPHDDQLITSVCATSSYAASAAFPSDLLRTDGTGRARLWLPPASHVLTINPNQFTAQTVPLSLTAQSTGVTVFVQFGTSGGPEAAPQLAIAGPVSVPEGSSVPLEATILAGTPTEVSWDLTGDGIFGDAVGTATSFDASSRRGPDTAPVAVRACDAVGRCTVDRTRVDVTNVAPVVAPVGPWTVAPGTEVQLTTTFEDPGVGDAHTGDVTVGGLTLAATVTSPADGEPGTLQAAFVAPSCEVEPPCQVPVTVRVFDGTAPGTTTALLTIAATGTDPGDPDPGDPDPGDPDPGDPDPGDPDPGGPLIVDAGGPYVVDEGATTALQAVVSGPADVSWDLTGDGLADVVGAEVTFDATARRGPASVTVTVRACDDDGCVEATTDVAIRNVAPVLAAVAPVTVAAGGPVQLGTSFADPGVGDVHTGWFVLHGQRTSAAITPPTEQAPGRIDGVVEIPPCTTEADCSHLVTIVVDDGDDEGSTEVTITVRGTPPDPGPSEPGPQQPRHEDDCKQGGWRLLTDQAGVPFGNQGLCVSYARALSRDGALPRSAPRRAPGRRSGPGRR